MMEKHNPDTRADRPRNQHAVHAAHLPALSEQMQRLKPRIPVAQRPQPPVGERVKALEANWPR